MGTCTGAVGTVAFDQFGYTECTGTDLGIAVLDGDAGGSVTVTVTSDGTGDSETVTIVAAGPNYESTLPYSAGDGRAHQRADPGEQGQPVDDEAEPQAAVHHRGSFTVASADA